MREGRRLVRLPGLWVSDRPEGRKVLSLKLRKPVIYGFLLAYFALVASLVIYKGMAGAIVPEDGGLVVQDFASHLAFTRAFWRGDHSGTAASSAYTVAFHLNFMSEWLGTPATRALPFGYSPTMLWLLLPLSLFPIPIAYFLWTLVGAAATGAMVSNPRVSTVPGLAVFLTPIALGVVALGQTAVLGTAAVFFLANRALSRSPAGGGKSWVHGLVPIMLLWSLTAKPPLAVSAGVALLATGKARTVALAAALAALGAAAVTPWLGSGWMSDYVSLITHYDRVSADPAFMWSLRPDHMSNLRGFLHVDLGFVDDLASRLSNLLWLISLGLVLVAGRLKWIRPHFIWALAVLSYLLFCAHVSSTEEILLLLVPAVLAPRGSQAKGRLDLLMWLAIPGALLLSPVLGPAAGLRPSLLWIAKLGLTGWVLVLSLRSRRVVTLAGPNGAES